MDVPPELFPAAGSEESDGLVPEPRAAEGGGGAGGARSDFSGFRWADSMELDRIFQKASSLVCGRPFPEEGGEGDGDGEGEIVEAEEQQRFVIPVGDHDLYGNDFGWGKPIASRNGKGRDFDGKLTISPAAESGGVDLEVCLATEKMAAMEDGGDGACFSLLMEEVINGGREESSNFLGGNWWLVVAMEEGKEYFFFFFIFPFISPKSATPPPASSAATASGKFSTATRSERG